MGMCQYVYILQPTRILILELVEFEFKHWVTLVAKLIPTIAKLLYIANLGFRSKLT